MGQAASHALVAAADLQPPLAMGVSGLEAELGESAQHIKMLGSTRFMKTILCKAGGEGQLVLHVFMRPASMNLDVGRQTEILRSQYARLEGCQRVAAQTRVISDERAVYILRQHLHNNLYDRISTRPFLSNNEKRWIAAQILMALQEAHERGVCHGDVKSENLVMTSWNLASLADFAPFKPTYLPADDPAEFNFYFDASARQCCCIAPERFYDAGSSIAHKLAGSSDGGDEELGLRPSMDIFSAGCVIAELFLDGNPLFSLGRLLQYRRGAVDAAALLADIPDREAAELVRHMIQLDPAARATAGEYLKRWAGMFPRAPRAAYMGGGSADARMQALYDETAELADDCCEIAASVACANVRNCRQPSARSMGIRVMLRCSRGGMRGDPDVLLPYLVALGSDVSPRVRAEAVVAVRDLLLGLRRLTPINANLFDDYVVPHLQSVAGDASVSVRCMVAAVLGDITDTAFFLTRGAAGEGLLPSQVGEPRPGFLANQIRAVVARLSFDVAEVKHVLLCAFPQLYERGVQSLSHIITYLNDRECWFLRAAFFDVVFAASAQISRHASREYVVPLVSLADAELFVVVSALRALVRLVPQMSRAMCWDRLMEVQALARRRPPLRRAACEFCDFVLAHAALPMSPTLARLALDIARAEDVDAQARDFSTTSDEHPASQTPVPRVVQLREIGAAVKTVFLTPVTDPWAAPAHGGSTPVDDPWAAPTHDAFLRKKALELALPPLARRPRLESWRPQGTLVGEVVEHNDAVTCITPVAGGLFVSGSDDGSVRVFDANSFRKSAVCRAHAKLIQGGRITALVYHDGTDCLASASDNGSIRLLRALPNALMPLASAALDAGEHAVALAFARGAAGLALVACTSRSRVLFYDVADLRLQEVLTLAPALGRPTCMVGDGAALVVVATAEGNLRLIDTRFRIELRTFRHFLAHCITALAMLAPASLLVATAPGDVCVLNMRDSRWPMCLCSRSMQELKANEVNRRLRVNCLARVPNSTYFITAGNDSIVRYWVPDRLDRSYVVTSSETAPPYSSYRLNDTVYYCENSTPAAPRSPSVQSAARLPTEASNAVAANSSRPGGPITALTILPAPVPMLVTGLQSGAIRVLL
ncbi:Serine/threonine-protein kinase [Coemansia sp. RSA 1365]|nr:Serine/threonine-protein kinase [Coemansia sp. RSA 1365]